MRQITPRPLVSIIGYLSGGYRAFQVIGAILITLVVIGLAGGIAISNNSSKILNNFEGRVSTGRCPAGQSSQPSKNNNNNYYPGPRMSPESSQPPAGGQDPDIQDRFHIIAP
jgi:hypothetical protein